MKLLFLFAFCFALYSSIDTVDKCPDIETVDLDLQKFSGNWYEVGISPFAKYVFQPGCHCVASKYSKTNEPNLLDTVSRCNLMKKDGVVMKLPGTLLQPFQKNRGKLLTSFFPGVYFPYWVLDTDYESYAVVWSCFQLGMSSKRNVWIISRTPTIDKTAYDKIIKKIKEKTGKAGFDVATLIKQDNEGCKFDDNN
eukprot:gene1715-484_t